MGKKQTAKNLVIVDVDVEYGKILQNRSRGRGYVTIEYYYDVSDTVFDRLAQMQVFYLYSLDVDTVMNTLQGMTPFDGISSGNASLARREFDKDSDHNGHSQKIRSVIEQVKPERILRICHTLNQMFVHGLSGDIKMLCRSFFVDPATLEQTPAVSSPNPADVKWAKFNRGGLTTQKLLDFLDLRKEFHQKAEASISYELFALFPQRDYDTQSMFRIAKGNDLDDMKRQASEWIRKRFDDGELELDRTLLTVTCKDVGSGKKRGLEGKVQYRSRRSVSTIKSAEMNQTEITMMGKKLPVRMSQPLVVFKVVPKMSQALQFKLAESDAIEALAHMLDDAMAHS